MLVVGGGPAGAAAAWRAAALGLDVLVLERRLVPGEPLQCGEWLPAAARVPVPAEAVARRVSVLRTWWWAGAAGKPAAQDEAGGAVFPGAAFAGAAAPGGGWEREDVRAPGLFLHRPTLERWLLKQARRAGAEVRLGAAAVAVEQEGRVRWRAAAAAGPERLVRRGLVTGAGGAERLVHADLVVGADGAASLVGRSLGAGQGRLTLALQVKVRCAPAGAGAEPEVYLHPALGAGYAWFFPKGEMANVGVGGDRSAGAARLLGLLVALHRRLADLGLVEGESGETTGGLIPAGGLVRPLWGGRLLLAGDAAGLAHPVTGAGIANAMASGFLAGEAAADFRRRGEAALARYGAELERLFGPSLARGSRRLADRDALLREGDRPFAEVARRTWVSFRQFWEEGEERGATGLGGKHGNAVRALGRMATSTAAAMALGLVRGRFHRNASTGCLNLLQVYEEGCRANCTYCGLARERVEPPSGRTFIRVPWPEYPVEVLAERARAARAGTANAGAARAGTANAGAARVGTANAGAARAGAACAGAGLAGAARGGAGRAGAVGGGCGGLRRVCVGMVTHPRALEDAVAQTAFFRRETGLPVSVLMSAALFRRREDVEALHAAGADRGTVAIDAATPALFARHRGRAAGGPHDWEHSWRVVAWCVKVFGPRQAGIHLIAGLGETEQEMAECIQRAHDLGAMTHLFSFYPEAGSRLAGCEPPPVGHYRRVQLARHLINGGFARVEGMRFDAAGRIVDFGVDVEPHLREGRAFLTAGCPGEDGELACNRPYGNERPGGVLRNYPFQPEPEDLAAIRRELGEGLGRAARL